MPVPVATMLAGPPAEPGLILIDADSTVAPAGNEAASCFFIICVKQGESFGLRNVVRSEFRALYDRKLVADEEMLAARRVKTAECASATMSLLVVRAPTHLIKVHRGARPRGVRLRRLELAVLPRRLLRLLRLPWLPLITRRIVVLRRVRGLLPGRFLRAAGTAPVLAGIIVRPPRLVFGLPLARLPPRLALWIMLLPVDRLRELTRLTLVLAVRHLVILPGPIGPETAECTPPA